MIYVCYTYADDAAMLGMVAERLRQLDDSAIIYAISDPAAPLNAEQLPEGVRHRLGTEKRQGNLNGLPIVAEELQTFLALMELHGAEACVKIDADCYPLSLHPLETEGEMVICERFEPLTPAGMIYRLTRKMAQAILALFQGRVERQEWVPAHYPEDKTLWQLALHTQLPVALLPYTSGVAAGAADAAPGDMPPHIKKACFIHCGEPLANGQRVSRVHATLRMRCLEAAIKAPFLAIDK